MSRITNDIRGTIRNRAIDSTFNPRKTALEKAEAKLAIVTGELAERVQKHSQDSEQYRKDYGAAQAKMAGFLEQFTSFKRLKEAWPEGEKFYKDLDADRISPKVPALITKEINDMLGIAKAKGAAT